MINVERLQQNTTEPLAVYRGEKPVTWESIGVPGLKEICDEYSSILQEIVGNPNVLIVPTGSIINYQLLRGVSNSYNAQEYPMNFLIGDLDVVVIASGEFPKDDETRSKIIAVNGKYQERVAQDLGLATCRIVLDLQNRPIVLSNPPIRDSIAKSDGSKTAIQSGVTQTHSRVRNSCLASRLYPEIVTDDIIQRFREEAAQFDKEISSYSLAKEAFRMYSLTHAHIEASSMTELVEQLIQKPSPRLKLKHIARVLNPYDYGAVDKDYLYKMINFLNEQGIEVLS